MPDRVEEEIGDRHDSPEPGHATAEPPIASEVAATDPAAEPAAPAAPAVVPSNKKFYIIKVQSGREDTIRASVERRVRIEGLEEHYARIVVPTQKVTEHKKGRDGKTAPVIKHHKKYPGYIFAEVEFNHKILVLFRETSGVGDFVGATLTRDPIPMTELEVSRMMMDQDDPNKESAPTKATKHKVTVEVGDRVRVQGGTFVNMEGDVTEILEPTNAIDPPRVKVSVTIFGRPVDVEVEHFQVERV